MKRDRWQGLIAVQLLLALLGCRVGSAPPPSQPAAEVIAASADSLMAIPGVVGVYEGASGKETVIRILVASKHDSLTRRLPKTLAGYRVELEVSGPVVPMGR